MTQAILIRNLLESRTDEQRVASPAEIVATSGMCLVGLIAQALNLTNFEAASGHISPSYMLYFALCTILTLTCAVGLQQMRRWAVYGYTLMFITNQAVLVNSDKWSIVALFIPVAVMMIVLRYFNKMR